MEEEAAEVSAGAATLLQEAAELEHPLSDRGVTSVAAASWVPGRAFHHTARRWRFIRSGLAVLIAPLPSLAIASLHLDRPVAASTHRERLIMDKTVLLETAVISEIVSKTAA